MNSAEPEFEDYMDKLESGIAFEHLGKKDTRKNICHASIQVENSYRACSADGFKFICIYSSVVCTEQDLARRKFDLYGICDFFALKMQPDFKVACRAIYCYGFYESLFSLYKNIQGVFLFSDAKKYFLPNIYSDEFESLMQSEFLKPIRENENWTLVNPRQEYTSNEAIFLDKEQLRVRREQDSEFQNLLSHENSTEVLAAVSYLKDKYAFDELNMEQGRQRAYVIGVRSSK